MSKFDGKCRFLELIPQEQRNRVSRSILISHIIELEDYCDFLQEVLRSLTKSCPCMRDKLEDGVFGND